MVTGMALANHLVCMSGKAWQTIRKYFPSPSLPVRPGSVTWDGKYITVEGLGINTGVAVYRLVVWGLPRELFRQ